MINWKIRIKDPKFWIFIASMILSSLNIDPDSLTSWNAIYIIIKEIFGNPYKLSLLIVSLFGIVYDPTTKGLCDSERALNYQCLGGSPNADK